MTVSQRTFYCQECHKVTRLFLPTEQRNCGNPGCGESLFFLYQEGDFANTDDPGVIGNWLRVGLSPKAILIKI